MHNDMTKFVGKRKSHSISRFIPVQKHTRRKITSSHGHAIKAGIQFTFDN